MTRRTIPLITLFFSVLSLSFSICLADSPDVAFQETFEQGADRWQPSDKTAWKVKQTDAGKVYSQFKKKSDYQPPHRSPFNMSLLKQVTVTDFVLTARVRSTHEDYNHRDACLFFGYQDAANFYYVHLGKRTDDHANQIFIVNDKPRVKISRQTTPGTNWDDQWHTVKIVRKTDDGTIEVYFDDMTKPVMTAVDKTFTWGRIGLGSFDDTADFDDIKLTGKRAKPPAVKADAERSNQ